MDVADVRKGDQLAAVNQVRTNDLDGPICVPHLGQGAPSAGHFFMSVPFE